MLRKIFASFPAYRLLRRSVSTIFTTTMKTAENSTTPRGLNLRPPRLVLEEIPIIPAADCGPATDNLSTLMSRSVLLRL